MATAYSIDKVGSREYLTMGRYNIRKLDEGKQFDYRVGDVDPIRIPKADDYKVLEWKTAKYIWRVAQAHDGKKFLPYWMNNFMAEASEPPEILVKKLGYDVDKKNHIQTISPKHILEILGIPYKFSWYEPWCRLKGENPCTEDLVILHVPGYKKLVAIRAYSYDHFVSRYPGCTFMQAEIEPKIAIMYVIVVHENRAVGVISTYSVPELDHELVSQLYSQFKEGGMA